MSLNKRYIAHTHTHKTIHPHTSGVRVPGVGVQADGQRASGLHVRGHGGLAVDGGVTVHGDHSLAEVHLVVEGGEKEGGRLE